MGIYSDLTDEELLAEIAEYRGAVKKATLGGIGVVAGEGRRIEYIQGNVAGAQLALRELEAEAVARGLTDSTRGAIGVEIG